MKIQYILSTLVLILLTTGCATTSKVTKIDSGMSKAQVVTKIGSPYKKQVFKDNKGNNTEVWAYQDTTWDDGGWSWNRTVVRSNVIFINGIVNNISNDSDIHLRNNPVLPVAQMLQNQQAINAYNARTGVLAQPVNVNVNENANIDATVRVYNY